jgi:predicted Zn-dependent peptidase
MTNAATSHDYAHFFIIVAAHQLSHTLPYLADLLLYAAIPEEEFDRERQVVLEEIRQAEDDLDWLGFQAMAELVYQDHAYGRPVLGWADRLQSRSVAEMRCFHQAHYQPHNMTVVLTGDLSLETAVDLVSRAFQDFPSPCPCPAPATAPLPQLQGVRREILELPRLEQSRLTMAWLGPGMGDLTTAYGLDVLAAVLGQGRRSRLVRELLEERQLVQDITASLSLQRDCSLFTVQIWLDRPLVDRVEAMICDRLSALAQQPIPSMELHRAQRLLCNDYAFAMETPGQLAGLYGYYSTLGGADHCFTYVPTIQQYTAPALQQLASQYLTPLHYVSTVLHPA